MKKPEIAQVIAAYKASGSEQLDLEKGQLINVRRKNPSGWWEGEMQVKGKKRQIGWFPGMIPENVCHHILNFYMLKHHMSNS